MVLGSRCTAAHLVPNTCHPQWEVSMARESGRGHALGPALCPRVCHVPAQHIFSVVGTPWTCHRCQAESPSLQCVFDHERSKKLGRRSPSFTFYSPVIWRTICPIWAIYCANFFPRSAAGARWAGARWFCALGVPPHLAGVTPPPQLLLYNLIAGCSTRSALIIRLLQAEAAARPVHSSFHDVQTFENPQNSSTGAQNYSPAFTP